ncbi:Dps family protein [Prevotella ihumii]|uniref:Dps family protein n=1 Tax=Prevotella ihumii TaxID=1917878 RepID=UPI00098129F8|nr:DNA starvation/stationary phase protection protein [Prevotella ihumii]
MNTLEFTGLDEKKVKNIISGLAQLLADYQIYYTNLRNLHWNVKGHGFFIMHEKYEEMYNIAATQIDDIAERILQLGGKPESRFSEYLKVSAIKEIEGVDCGKQAIELILSYYKLLIAQERAIIEAASEAGDDVTADLMTGWIAAQEKSIWMLVAFSQEKHHGECGCEK